jgi:oligoribonuclease (3'-5' exoribonuclease)
LGENDTGKMKLEVIAEDTYFLPWESDFEVDTAKKIKVEVKQQRKKPLIKSSKPKMVVKEVKHPFNPVDKVVDVLHKQGVGVSTIYESKKTMIPMLKKYSTKAGYKRGAKNFIKEVIQKLSKK